MELLSFRVRPRLQVTLKDLTAMVVLAQRLSALAGSGVEPHQQSVRLLPRGIEDQQLLRRCDCGLAGSGSNKPLVHGDGEIVKPCALNPDPILEGAVVQAVAVK